LYRSERQDGPRRAGDRRVRSWRSYVSSRSGVFSQNGKPSDAISLCPSAGTAARVGSCVLRRLAGRTTCTQLAPRVHAAPMPACVQPAGSSRHQAPLPRSGGALARAQLCIPSYTPACPGSLRVARRPGRDQPRQPPPPLPTERTPPVKPPLPHPTHSTLARHSSADRGALLPSGRLSTTGQPAIVASSDPGLSHSEAVRRSMLQSRIALGITI
jgi:hypothetical protein